MHDKISDTNLLDPNLRRFGFCVATIPAIYKDRWRIEIFFRTIKQILQIKAFVCASRNAVLSHIWIAMITYLLVAFTRNSARVGCSLQKTMRVLQLNLFDCRSLKDILPPSSLTGTKKRTSNEVRFMRSPTVGQQWPIR